MARLPDAATLALPYVDSELDHPGVRDTVLALIDAELASPSWRPDLQTYLVHLPRPPHFDFERHAFLEAEFARLTAQQPQCPITTARYEVPPPEGKAAKHDLDAWQASVNNAQAQLEHQHARAINTDLLVQYGPQAWKMAVTDLDRMHAALTKRLAQFEAQLQEVNWARKTEQTAAHVTLYQLERQWGELLAKNRDIEFACQALEAELGPS